MDLETQQYLGHVNRDAQDVVHIVQRTIHLMIAGRHATTPSWRRAISRARRARRGARPPTRDIPEYLENVEQTTVPIGKWDLEIYDRDNHRPPRNRRRGKHPAPREQTRRTPSQNYHRLHLLMRNVDHQDRYELDDYPQLEMQDFWDKRRRHLMNQLVPLTRHPRDLDELQGWTLGRRLEALTSQAGLRSTSDMLYVYYTAHIRKLFGASLDDYMFDFGTPQQLDLENY